MVLSKHPESFFDPYRQKWVVMTPEEGVRQSCLRQLEVLGYPKSLMAVEKSLKELMGVARPPKRRADILCFDPRGRPLLLVECKAVPLTEAMQRQLMGYNFYIEAPFIALVSSSLALFAAKNGPFSEGLRPFAECVACL